MDAYVVVSQENAFNLIYLLTARAMSYWHNGVFSKQSIGG